MTTSLVSTFNPAFVFVATSAYRKLGVINENENPTAGMIQDAYYAANSLVKEWMATGLHVWTEEEAVLFLEPGQVRYQIGGDVTTNTSDAFTYVLGELTSTAVLGATSLAVDSIVGISRGDNIGIVLDTGVTQWTTVSHTPTGTTVRITDALTDAAGALNDIFVYTTRILRPLKVPEARLLYWNGLLETPMNEFSRQEYMDLPNKYTPGTPTAFFYTPKLESGELFIWPAPQNSNYAVRFTWYRPIFDFTSNADTADMPNEWNSALTWNLAVELAPDFSIPAQRFAILKAMAAEKLELVLGFDREAQPIYFQLGNPEAGRS